MKSSTHPLSGVVLGISGACLLAGMLLFSHPAPVAGLPPRPPTVTPTPQPSHVDVERPFGAHIQLRVTPLKPGIYSAVQWQDGIGNWHVVEGWQGGLEDAGGTTRIWWVAPRDFATGPFRWVVYERQGGPLLAASPSFMLPVGPDTLVVEVSLVADT